MKKFILTIFSIVLLFSFNGNSQTIPILQRINPNYMGGLNPQGLVLHLPFWALALEAQKIWDYSGNNNHGTITGAIPASYPLLSGTELVSNGGMESGDPPTDWINGSLTTWEQSNGAAIGGLPGQYTKAAHVVSPGGYKGFVQSSLTSGFTITCDVGKTYRLTYWYYIVSGSFFHYVGGSTEPGHIDSQIPYTTTGSWQYIEATWFEATGGDHQVEFIDANVEAEYYITGVSIRQIFGYESLGWVLDGVNDKIVITGAGAPPNTATILVWAKHNSGIADSFAMGWRDAGAPMIAANYTGNGKPVIYLADNYWKYFVAQSDGQLKLWNCYAFQIDATTASNIKLFINATLQSEDITDTSIPGYRAGSDNLSIGVRGGIFKKSIVGEVLIFNRALSPTEIKNYYELTRYRYSSDARDILIEYAEELKYDMAA